MFSNPYVCADTQIQSEKRPEFALLSCKCWQKNRILPIYHSSHLIIFTQNLFVESGQFFLPEKRNVYYGQIKPRTKAVILWFHGLQKKIHQKSESVGCKKKNCQ